MLYCKLNYFAIQQRQSCEKGLYTKQLLCEKQPRKISTAITSLVLTKLQQSSAGRYDTVFGITSSSLKRSRKFCELFCNWNLCSCYKLFIARALHSFCRQTTVLLYLLQPARFKSAKLFVPANARSRAYYVWLRILHVNSFSHNL